MSEKPVERRTYSVTEAAKILGIGTTNAYALVRSGELPGARVVGENRFLVSKKELDAFVDGD